MKIITSLISTLCLLYLLDMVRSNLLEYKILHPINGKQIGLMIYGATLEIRCSCDPSKCKEIEFRKGKDKGTPSSDTNQTIQMTIDNSFVLGEYTCVFDNVPLTVTFPYRLCSPDELKQFCYKENKCSKPDYVPYCVVTKESGGPMPSCEMKMCENTSFPRNVTMIAYSSYQTYEFDRQDGNWACVTLRRMENILSEGTATFNSTYHNFNPSFGGYEMTRRTFGMFFKKEIPSKLANDLRWNATPSWYIPLNSSIHIDSKNSENVYFETSVTPIYTLTGKLEEIPLDTENYVTYSLTVLLDGLPKTKTFKGNENTTSNELGLKELLKGTVGGSYVSMYSVIMDYGSSLEYWAITYGSFVITDPSCPALEVIQYNIGKFNN